MKRGSISSPSGDSIPVGGLRARVIKGKYDEGQEIILLLPVSGLSGADIKDYNEHKLYWTSYRDTEKLRANIGKNVWVMVYDVAYGGIRNVGDGDVKTSFWESRQGIRLLSMLVLNAILLGLILIFRKSSFVWLPAVIIFLGFFLLVFYGLMNSEFWG